MSDAELRISGGHWRTLRRHLDGSFRSESGDEAGALALLGEIRTERRHVFTIVKVVLPRAGEVEATPRSLRFTADYIRRVHLEMRERGLAGVATFHTHPEATNAVEFSDYDDAQDPGLVSNLTELAEGTRLVSVVLGHQALCGRVWTVADHSRGMKALTVVGERFLRMPLNGALPPPPPSLSAAFDRAAALTGTGSLALLGTLTVAVVGVSGIGSLVSELLVRSGCGVVQLIEHDRVRDENLNRILHTTTEHARELREKVRVLGDAIRATGLRTKVLEVPGNVLDLEVVAQLHDADVVIGCLDRDWPRELLSKFSYQFLVPYIDLGTEIGTDESGMSLESLDARVSYVAPGRWCLSCAGYVDPRRTAFESMTVAERGRVVQLGYADDLLLKRPAVMELNMRAASLGVLVLRHLLQPFLLEPLPVAIKENVAMFSLRAITEPHAKDPACTVCRNNPQVGAGDCGPPLGYPRAAIAARQ